MLVSPFTFLRGAAAVMAQDLKHEPSAGIPVQACGDCHLMNFGAFATPEEIILFDINDFDETLPGVDFTVDLKRLAASVAVAALDAKFSNKRARAAAATTVAAYRTRMRALAKLSPLEIWHSRIELAQEIEHIEDRDAQAPAPGHHHQGGQDDRAGRQLPASGQGHQDRRQAADDLSFQAQGRRAASRRCRRRVRVLPQAPAAGAAVPARAIRAQGHRLQGGRRRKRGHVLRRQPVHERRRRALFLQFKEAGKSVLECLGPKFDGHPGRRVVEGQRTMQAASDIFLGWTEDAVSGRHFYVRHLKNRRLGSIGELVEEKCPRQLRPPVRPHPRPRPCALGRSGDDRGIHRKERCLRRCAGVFRDGLCRPHAAGLRPAGEGEGQACKAKMTPAHLLAAKSGRPTGACVAPPPARNAFCMHPASDCRMARGSISWNR